VAQLCKAVASGIRVGILMEALHMGLRIQELLNERAKSNYNIGSYEKI